MDCTRCRSLFSERLEGHLAPVVLEEMTVHLAACPACRRELWEVEKSIELLRSAEREEPPAELAAAIQARLPVAASTVGGTKAPRVLGWRAAAAAVVIASLIGGLIWRELSWTYAIRDLRRTLADGGTEKARLERAIEIARGCVGELQDELSAVRKGNRRLAGDLERAAAARQETEARFENAERRFEELERDLARLRDAHRRELTELREVLAAARADAERLGRERDALELALSSREAVSEKKDALAHPDRTVAASPPGDVGSGTAPRRKSVFFIERGDQMELAVRGPRNAVVAELFQIARDQSNPDTAHLALTALENVLAGEVEAVRAEQEEPPVSGAWLTRGLQSVARELGINGGSADNQAETARDRLEELEEAWRRQKAADGGV